MESFLQTGLKEPQKMDSRVSSTTRKVAVTFPGRKKRKGNRTEQNQKQKQRARMGKREGEDGRERKKDKILWHIGN